MEQVTITVSEETKERFDRLVRTDYAGDSDAATEDLLAEWIERQG